MLYHFEGKLSAAEARKKWKALRTQYYSILEKEKKAIESGRSCKKTKWRLYNQMEFLRDHAPKIKRYINSFLGVFIL